MPIPNTSGNLKRSLLSFIAAAILVILPGIVAIIGWFTHIDILTSVSHNYVSMKFNTALCFIILGSAFLLMLKGNSLASKNVFIILMTCLGIISGLTIIEQIFNWNVGIDQFFVADPKAAAQGLPPGRMALSSAFCFTLLAVSFLGIDSKSIAYKKVAQIFLHVVTLIAFIAIIGYLLRVPNSFTFVFFSSMAINTAICFMIISVAAAGINYNLGITSLFTGQSIGNVVARKLFPRMVIILLLLGYLSIKLERAHYINDEVGIVLSTMSFILISLFLLWNTLNEMNRLDQKRTEAEQETLLLNKNLESMVLQRTLDLKNSNDRFIKIFDSNPVCIALTNLESGQYADVNDAILKLLHYSREELIGHTAAELAIVSPEYRQYMIDSLRKNGFLKNEEVQLKDKYGNIKHCLINADMVEFSDEKYMMSFVYDITNRKLVEDNLQETKKSLEVLTDKLTNQNKQLLNFAHITSHNLRSPVSNLNLLLHFYKESTTIEDKEDLWGNFETVVHHLNTTLDELLEALKIQDETNKVREELSFEQTFNLTREMLLGQIMESKAVIKADFSKAPQIVYPKTYLESIMLNLVSNAIKYRSASRVPEIKLVTEDVNGELTLTIQDNGMGIDLERHKDNLFGLRKTFHRHAEAKGLGLFITKTQVEAMGGTISATSKVEKGTTFKVVFNKK